MTWIDLADTDPPESAPGYSVHDGSAVRTLPYR
jgi:hypothetical protein